MTLREKRQNLNGKGEEVSYCCYATHENLDDNTNKPPHFFFQIRTFQILNQFFFSSNYNHNIFLVIYLLLLLLYIGRYGQNNKKKNVYVLCWCEGWWIVSYKLSFLAHSKLSVFYYESMFSVPQGKIYPCILSSNGKKKNYKSCILYQQNKNVITSSMSYIDNTEEAV